MTEEYGLVDPDPAEEPGDEWEEIDVSDTAADRIARQADREFNEFRKRIKDADQFKVEESVFDDATFGALYKLVQDGYVDAFGGPISTGKEANVYTALGGGAAREVLDPEAPATRSVGDERAGDDESDETGRATDDGDSERCGRDGGTDAAGDDAARGRPGGDELEVAVKVYRINASNFQDMREYLEGDPRFEGEGGDKKAVVLSWVNKEYRNLERARKAGVRVPTPLAVERNVLVMEYIGTEAGRARRLSEVEVENPETAYEVLREYMRRLYDAGLIHGDLSEYNVVFHEGELVVIDLGQAVTVHHPNAEDFLRRDCRNVANFFARQGLDVTGEDCYEYVTGGADPE